jgi:hypothetical protein
MSAEVEQVFSSAGLTITPRRSLLSDESIEAIECLKSWDSAGFVVSLGVAEIQETMEALVQTNSI